MGEADVRSHGRQRSADTAAAADSIARHVFASEAQRIDRLDYSIEYALIDEDAGGDVADVYQFDNGSVALMAADVAGHGTHASALATMIKFGLRAYASCGMTPEVVTANLDRLYRETCAFEHIESFASVFFAHVDQERNTLGYCSAGHDVAVEMRPNEDPRLIPVTAPVIGIFDHQDNLFRHRYISVVAGMVMIIGTDGITEARSHRGELFGTERLLDIIASSHDRSMREVSTAILDASVRFSGERTQDDMAVLAVQFH